MKKLNKFLLAFGSLSSLATLPIISVSCGNDSQSEIIVTPKNPKNIDNTQNSQNKTEIESTKKEYDEVVKRVLAFIDSLTDQMYSEIKNQLTQKYESIDNKIPSSNYKIEDFLNGKTKLEEAEREALQAKQAKDKEKNNQQTSPATTSKPEQPESKPAETPQDESSTTPKPKVSKDGGNSDEAQSSAQSNSHAKESNISDQGQEELTEEQKEIVKMVENKTIFTGTLTEETKKKIQELSKKNKDNGFGYIKTFDFSQKKVLDIPEFGEKQANANNKLEGITFNSKFVKLLNNKKIVYAYKFGKRKALNFKKKEDGKIVIPFKFDGKTKIYEIELF
ncbi:variable surface lipoprotein [Metamycoplasma canadense]|uniref:Variable surface lipoprotein n=1 Tax=Metamycoplasma canadense TaxID=29554 RepID=A0A077LB01_9BACT|nr:variable surface lipoprotein [Metamycoplasma canadense]BAP39369.1 hypothetical protein MCAN360_0082 [Metamycoplasma canadense]